MLAPFGWSEMRLPMWGRRNPNERDVKMKRLLPILASSSLLVLVDPANAFISISPSDVTALIDRFSDGNRPRHENHVVPASGRFRSDGKSHLPAGRVGDKPHGIEVLSRRACSHKNSHGRRLSICFGYDRKESSGPGGRSLVLRDT